MKHFVFAIALIACIGLCTAAIQRPAEDHPAVIRAVAPSEYPFAGTAKKPGAEGKVVVDVKIDALGEVTKIVSVQGHELLKAPSAQAARQWTFAPGANERHVQLTLIYSIGDKEKTSFNPPYEIEFIGTVPRFC